VAVPTSVENKIINNEFSVYPNPNSGQFKLKINSDKTTEIFLEIYGINGQIVYFNRFSKGNGIAEFTVDMGIVNKGVYIMKAFDGKRYHTKKIVVK